MIPEKVQKLCQSGLTLSDELAKDPSQEPSHLCKKLYRSDADHDIFDDKLPHAKTLGEADLQQAALCGNWGSSRPSELFLQVIFFKMLLALLTTE